MRSLGHLNTIISNDLRRTIRTLRKTTMDGSPEKRTHDQQRDQHSPTPGQRSHRRVRHSIIHDVQNLEDGFDEIESALGALDPAANRPAWNESTAVFDKKGSPQKRPPIHLSGSNATSLTSLYAIQSTSGTSGSSKMMQSMSSSALAAAKERERNKNVFERFVFITVNLCA